MPLITQSIPNLIGGVSQQAPAIRSVNQCEDMVNAFPSPIEGLVKRSPTSKVAEIRNASNTLYTAISSTNVKPHLIVRDSTEKFFVFIRPAATAADCRIEVYGLDGTKKTVHYGANSQDYLVNATRASLKALTVADVTFVVNTSKKPALSASVTTAVNYARVALVYIKQSAADRDFTITVTDANGSNPLVATHKATSGAPGTDHVATDLAADLNGNGVGVAYAATATDSVVYITRNQDFNITVEDDYGGQAMVLIRDKVQRFEDLPSTAPNNYIVKVLGAPESEIDDYFVKFQTEGAQSFARGVWAETIAPNTKYLYDFATMPHILIRQSDGSFLFKRADGITPASPTAPAGADYSGYKWADRLVGDVNTNSDPSFVGVEINNIVLFKNRLGFLSDENIILSETSEFFNFWRTTVLDLPDSDPIDVASSSPKIGKLKSGTVFNTELILFTDSSQLVLRGGEILSPKSVALLPVGDYENYSDIQPVSSGLSVFFPYNRGGGFAGVREMIPQPNIDGSYVVTTATEVVPSYIVGKPVHTTATTQDDMAAVVSDGTLYMYKYLKSGDNLVQSAWFKYMFPDIATGGFAEIVWAEFVDMELYVLVLRTNNKIPVLEKMPLGTALNDAPTVKDSNWLVHLDQKAFADSGSYDANTGLTTWTLEKPYSYIPGLSAVYTPNGAALTVVSGTSYNLGSDTAGTISVRGDYSTAEVWVGLKYEMKYQFSQIWLQGRAGRSGQGEAALQSGRYQLRNLSLLYEDTSFFRVKVAADTETAYQYDYSGLIVGSNILNQIYLNRGTFRLPIYGRNTTTTITIVNDTALPCKLLSAEVEAEYTDRAQRFG
jgi:hypothetical protein